MGSPVVHFDIGCRDLGRAREFYGALFGWTFSRHPPSSLKIMTGAPGGVDGFLTCLGHAPYRYVMPYVEVKAIAPVLECVARLGGSIVVPETSAEPDHRFAWVCDPDGNLLGLWRSSDSAL